MALAGRRQLDKWPSKQDIEWSADRFCILLRPADRMRHRASGIDRGRTRSHSLPQRRDRQKLMSHAANREIRSRQVGEKKKATHGGPSACRNSWMRHSHTKSAAIPDHAWNDSNGLIARKRKTVLRETRLVHEIARPAGKTCCGRTYSVEKAGDVAGFIRFFRSARISSTTPATHSAVSRRRAARITSSPDAGAHGVGALAHLRRPGRARRRPSRS
jgi:hypothetical protein